jgi:hypothetical protein
MQMWRHSLISDTASIEKSGREAEVNAVVAKARCSRWRIKKILKVGLCLFGGRVRPWLELRQSSQTRNLPERKKKPLPL